jgi:P27 family predicted phage terminase small subunit
MVRLLWDTIQRYHEVHQAMQGKPLTYQTDKGYQGQVPEVSMLNKCIEQIVTLSAKFGMSPADRTRLGEAPPTDTKKKADPFEAHLKLVGNL